MNPDEMQTPIEHLRQGAHVLFAIADEPGQTSVHPSGTINRERVETRASNADVEDVFGFVTD